ncbi:hypothetical protein HDU78_001843 [Chytriomyces hyalinus]|nr:hypothetical protein HDU78_001843 [Chytriomyces hyalinus]
MGGGASTPAQTISASPRQASYCSWCMKEVPRTLAPIVTSEDPTFVLFRCPFHDCERSLRKCIVADCPNYACADAYVIPPTKPQQKPKRISRNDNSCLIHLRLCASFEKAAWPRIPSLLAFKSIHASSLGDSSAEYITSTVGCAVGLLATTPPAGLVCWASKSLISGLSSAMSGFPEDTMDGVGRNRYTQFADHDGMPLGHAVSVLRGYSFYKQMPVFREKGFIMERSGHSSLPVVVTIDGFLHSCDDARLWSKLMDSAFPNNTWLSLQWDASPVSWSQDSAVSLLSAVPSQLPGFLASGALNAMVGITQSRNNCQRAGYLLADAVARLDGSKRVVLMGHSLGACVIFHALQYLAKSRIVSEGMRQETKLDQLSIPKKVDRVFLLGSACPHSRNDCEWEFAASEVERDVVNMYSDKDEVLTVLGDALGTARAGVKPISCPGTSNIVNLECPEVCGHFDWKPSLASCRLLS